MSIWIIDGLEVYYTQVDVNYRLPLFAGDELIHAPQGTWYHTEVKTALCDRS